MRSSACFAQQPAQASAHCWHVALMRPTRWAASAQLLCRAAQSRMVAVRGACGCRAHASGCACGAASAAAGQAHGRRLVSAACSLWRFCLPPRDALGQPNCWASLRTSALLRQASFRRRYQISCTRTWVCDKSADTWPGAVRLAAAAARQRSALHASFSPSKPLRWRAEHLQRANAAQAQHDAHAEDCTANDTASEAQMQREGPFAAAAAAGTHCDQPSRRTGRRWRCSPRGRR